MIKHQWVKSNGTARPKCGQTGRMQGTWPLTYSALARDAPSYSDPTAILSRFPSLLLDPTFAHVTTFIQNRVLGPETGWSMSKDNEDWWLWLVDFDGVVLSTGHMHCVSNCTFFKDERVHRFSERVHWL